MSVLTVSAPTSSRPAAPPRAGRREWLGLVVLFLPTLLVAVDNTVLSFALPAISSALAPSATELLWIVDIYPLALAGLLVTMGTLGDRLGRRRLLLIGVAGFGAVSAAAAFATEAAHLVAARALLGVFGAMLMPSTLALLRTALRRPHPAPPRLGHLGDRVRGGRGARTGDRWGPARARLVGLGLPGQRARDGGVAGTGAGRAARVSGVPGARSVSWTCSD